VAGGTDVLVDLRARKLRARFLMDISRLEPLKDVAETEEGLCIGAGVTLTEIRNSTVVARLAPSLHRAAQGFGSRQIRNTATIGGNVGNASPSADTAPPLLVHEARAVLRHINGERRVDVADLFEGPYRSGIRPEEILHHFVLRPAEEGVCDFQKIGRRGSLAIARVNMACMLRLDGSGGVRSARVALGSCTPTPRRMKAVERFLEEGPLHMDRIVEGGRRMAARMVEIAGRRPSTVYKEPAVQGLFVRMLAPVVDSGE
jgi:CO/xanthine dehydrogenase FAD-binding subunit